MRENTSFSAMGNLVNGAVDAEKLLLGWENRVELRFLNVRLAAIDGFQCRIGVERETIWSISKDWA